MLHCIPSAKRYFESGDLDCGVILTDLRNWVLWRSQEREHCIFEICYTCW